MWQQHSSTSVDAASAPSSSCEIAPHAALTMLPGTLQRLATATFAVRSFTQPERCRCAHLQYLSCCTSAPVQDLRGRPAARLTCSRRFVTSTRANDKVTSTRATDSPAQRSYCQQPHHTTKPLLQAYLQLRAEGKHLSEEQEQLLAAQLAAQADALHDEYGAPATMLCNAMLYAMPRDLALGPISLDNRANSLIGVCRSFNSI